MIRSSLRLHLRSGTFILFAIVTCCTTLANPRPDDQATTNWATMNHAQRKEYMKKTVFPKMKNLFGAFNEKKFGEMKCTTCHGAGAKDDSYKMPNPKLPKIPDDRAQFDALRKKHPDMVAFMHDKVVPTMAALLGKTHGDPHSNNNLGCVTCHTKD